MGTQAPLSTQPDDIGRARRRRDGSSGPARSLWPIAGCKHRGTLVPPLCGSLTVVNVSADTRSSLVRDKAGDLVGVRRALSSARAAKSPSQPSTLVEKK